MAGGVCNGIKAMRFIAFFVCFTFVEAPNWFTQRTLGRGVHASPQLKHAAGKAFRNLRTLIRDKVLVKGENFSTKFTQKLSVMQCVGFLLGISVKTVKRSVKFLTDNSTSARLPLCKKRGAKKLTQADYQAKYGSVYGAIFKHLKDAKKTGNTISVDKLILLLREEDPATQETNIELECAMREL